MDGDDGAEAIACAWRDGLTPDPLLTVSERANRELGPWARGRRDRP
jgi:hypothetical protein